MTPAPAAAARFERPGHLLIAGNANSGKTTLFNLLTGARARVGNYPGITVGRLSGWMTLGDGQRVEILDLPGTYSVSAGSRDEQIAVDALLGRDLAPPRAVIAVADATALGRSLYLISQLAEAGVPLVVALNLMDEARDQGLEIDTARLSQCLGVPVVPMVARRGEGIDQLREALRDPPRPAPAAIELPTTLVADVEEVEATLGVSPVGPGPTRPWALWALLSLADDDELEGVPANLRDVVRAVRARAERAGRDLDGEIIAARYGVIDGIVADCVSESPPESRSLTDVLDGILTHRLWGALSFAAVMLIVFQSLFSWAEPMMGLIEIGIARAQGAATSALPGGPLRDLLVEGVMAGVGNVLVFVPQIGLLFLLITLLEDSGYLARVAFVIDRLMGGIGLHGKAFVPMLSGFACAIPAVIATRTIEKPRDRLLTMLAIPLMSCSARLPVYVLVTAAVFDPALRVFGFLSIGALVLLTMYLLSVVAAIGAAAVMRRTVLRGPRPTLVLEMPPYRMPAWRNLVTGTWRPVRTFLTDAGSVILALTIVLWALLSYPRLPDAPAMPNADTPVAIAEVASSEAAASGAALRASFMGHLGRAIEPIIEPLGFDWRIGVGILGAFAAREVFISTLAIVFDIGEADEASQPLRLALHGATWPDGAPLMTPLAGVSLMVFFVFACQCMSTIAVIRKESGSWRWPAMMFAAMSLLAYFASLVVYQGGRLLGVGLGA